MFRFLRRLANRHAPAARHACPALEGLEDRLAPTVVGNLLPNPGVIRGFNPQPDPPCVQLIRLGTDVQVVASNVGIPRHGEA